jgi:hypothetical protein
MNVIPIPRLSSNKKTIILITGTAVAQAVSVIALPFLQRYYPPGQFASLNLFTTAVPLIASAATLKLEYAIVMAKEDREAFQIARIATIFTLFFLFFLWYFSFLSSSSYLVFYQFE